MACPLVNHQAPVPAGHVDNMPEEFFLSEETNHMGLESEWPA